MTKVKEEVNGAQGSAAMVVAEYRPTEAALAALRERLAGAKYEVTTTAGMETAKKDRRELVTLRTDLEKKRVEIKAPALERCRLIDAEAKRITGELLKLEAPIDEQIKAEEARKAEIKAEKERTERERVAAIRERIEKIKALPLLAIGASSLEIQEFIAKVEAREIGADFAELADEATAAKAEAVAKLNQMLEQQIAKEEEDARIKAEQDERDRISGIKGKIRTIQDWPRCCLGLNSVEMRAKHDELSVASKSFEGFDEFHDEAMQEVETALASIEAMIEATQKAEVAAAKLKEEQAELEFQRERDRKERERVDAIKQKISFIRQWTVVCAVMDAARLRQHLAEVEAYEVGAGFEEFEGEAEQAKCETLGHIRTMLTAAEEREAEAKRLEAQRKEQEAEQQRLDEAKRKEEEAHAAEQAEREAAVITEEPAVVADRAAGADTTVAVEMITITLSEYNQLKAQSAKLQALEAAGVDNWDGYDFAMEQLEVEG